VPAAEDAATNGPTEEPPLQELEAVVKYSQGGIKRQWFCTGEELLQLLPQGSHARRTTLLVFGGSLEQEQ